MSLRVIVGTQWGDEGKGRIVDWFAAHADFVARYNGGDNAGHTVTLGSQLFKLHLIPSGILHPKAIAVFGNGMVVNPRSLLAEMDSLRILGIDVTPQRLRLSHVAHLITPAHQAMDAALESARGKGSIGTTGRGIGPAYTDKASRRGLRIADLLAPDFNDKLTAQLADSNKSLAQLGASPLDAQPILNDFRSYAKILTPFVADTSLELALAL